MNVEDTQKQRIAELEAELSYSVNRIEIAFAMLELLGVTVDDLVSVEKSENCECG